MDDKTAYKEALERAKSYYESPRTCFDIDVLTDIFHELKNTDVNNERIRKILIRHIRQEKGSLSNDEAEKAIAWLEKQGQNPIINVPSREVILAIWDLGNEWRELTNGCISTEYGTQLDYIQKHWHESEYYLREKQGDQSLVNNPELKFNVGDWVVNKLGVTWHIDSFDKKNYQVTGRKGNHNYFPIAKQDEMRHWSITDAKPGDVLAVDSMPFIYNGSKNEVTVGAYCGLNVKHMFSFAYNYVINQNITPATKEQRDLLFQKMQEAGYIFDFEKKELQQIHVIDEKASPTYSEEDKEYNGDDYGIDSLYHAQRILEKTLGEVDGYQSDDGILEHKCAISAVKKLYEHKPTECIKFNNEFENQVSHLIASVLNGEHEYNEGFVKYVAQSLLNYAKNELKPIEWSEEDEQNLNVVLSYINDESLRRWLKDAINKRYDKPAEWSDEDESMYTRTLGILGKCYMGQLPTKVEDELKWLKSLNTQKNLKQICNTVDQSKNENEVLKLLYNELREKFKGGSIKVFI